MRTGYIITDVEPFIEKVQVIEELENWVEYLTDNPDATSFHLRKATAFTVEEAKALLKKRIEADEERLNRAKRLL